MEIFVVLALMFTNISAFHIPANDSETKGRIFRGFNAVEGLFPYVVFLEHRVGICSGVLIGREWVVTAAHCVHGQRRIYMYLGVTHLQNAKIAYCISERSFKIHPGWNIYTLEKDIALINIPPTDICEDIYPVPLPPLNAVHDAYVNKYAIISGWGQKGNIGSRSDRLQWTRVPIVSNANCVTKYTVANFHAEDEICVGTIDGATACNGDSGGPLVLDDTFELVGIFSSGTRDCEVGDPLIYVRITSYLHWIHHVTGISY